MHLNSFQIRNLNAISLCRTPALGGHVYVCDTCKSKHYRYNSCRNRHCSQCQNTQKEQWIEARKDQLIHSNYFHLVFTLPDVLNDFCLIYPKQIYNFLFNAAWNPLNEFGWNNKYLGAQIGATMVLHTWGANLSLHPHLHCIVPGGGVNYKNKWKDANGNGKFLFPVKALSPVYRSKFIALFKSFMHEQGMIYTTTLNNKLYQNNWVVYSKPPFGGANGVVRYLARYTYNIAISHHRIISYSKNHVTFSYTDYRHANQKKIMTLSPWEFIRRFALHILPKGFMRIRHFGILNSKSKIIISLQHTVKINNNWISFWNDKGLDVIKCPLCITGRLQLLGKLEPLRGPPRFSKSKTTQL